MADKRDHTGNEHSRSRSSSATPGSSTTSTPRATSAIIVSEADLERKVVSLPISCSTPPFSCPLQCGFWEDVIEYREHMETKHHCEFDLCKYTNCSRAISKNRNSKMSLAHHYRHDHQDSILKCTEHPNCGFKPTWDYCEHRRHVESHKLRCNVCLDERRRALPFKSDQALEEHMKKEHNNLDITCPIYDPTKGELCGRSFADTRARAIHLVKAHKGHHMCPYCPLGDEESFEGERSLAQHIKDKHPNELTDEWKALLSIPICEICSKQFANPSVLSKHIRAVHFKQRAFGCSTTPIEPDNPILVDDKGRFLRWDHATHGCDRSFVTKRVLLDHIRTEHFSLVYFKKYQAIKSGREAEKLAERSTKRRKTKVEKPITASGIITGVADRPVSPEPYWSPIKS